jgi:RNA polymerase sigma factor (sigma-70 family)
MQPPSETRAAAPQWEELRPVIDATLDELAARDREAVLLRFFEDLTFGQIGAALRISEDAARMRVERALERRRHRAPATRRWIARSTAP